MNYETNKIADKILFCSLLFFAIYTMCFQYVFFQIPGILPLLAIIIVATSFVSAKNDLYYYKYLFPILLFIVISMFSGAFFSPKSSYFWKYFVLIIQYCIPMFGIYSYIGIDRKRIKNIAYLLYIAGVMVAITAIMFGKKTNTGAISIGDLNSNSLATYITVGLIGISYVILNERRKTNIFFHLVSILICSLSIINAASRRGVLILVFIVAYLFLLFFKIKLANNSYARLALVFFLLISALVVFVSFNDLFGNTVIFKRFNGMATGGDAIRKDLQRTAMDYFKSNPLFGRGFGCVLYKAGLYSHSFFYETLASTGSIGIILLLGGLIKNCLYYFQLLTNVWNVNEEYTIEYATLLFSVISILICGVAVVMIYDMYFYFLLGLYAGASHTFSEEQMISDDINNELYFDV